MLAQRRGMDPEISVFSQVQWGMNKRRAPGTCGEAPGAEGVMRGKPNLLLLEFLFRRLRRQQTKSAQLFVGKNHHRAAGTFFHVADPRGTREASEFLRG